MKQIKGLLIFFLILIILKIVSHTREEEARGSAPLINNSLDPLTISCDYTREDLLRGLTAYDTEDGYITDRIIPGKLTPFTEKGVSEIEYYVYDSNNNCGRYKRQVVFSDYESPKAALSNPLVFYEEEASDGVIMDYLYGNDLLDGNVMHVKVTDSNIDYNRAGDYKITVSLTNSFGDTSTYSLPVHIIKKSYRGLEIRLNESLIYIEKGTQFKPEDYVKEVELSQTGDLMPRKDWGMEIHSNVDTSKAGVYEVSYSIKKERDEVYGSISGITWLTVIVAD